MWLKRRGLDLPHHAPGGRIIGAPWSRYKRVRLPAGLPGQITWPLCPLTLVERIAAIAPSESQSPGPDLEAKVIPGAKQLTNKQTKPVFLCSTAQRPVFVF